MEDYNTLHVPGSIYLKQQLPFRLLKYCLLEQKSSRMSNIVIVICLKIKE